MSLHRKDPPSQGVRVPQEAGDDRERFIADAMVADLARWLRILGEDCLWAPPDWSDPEVLQAAKQDDRVLVTRDERLIEQAQKNGVTGVLVPQQETAQTLAVIYRALGCVPHAHALASRCSMCNGPLERVDADEAARRAERAGKTPPLEAVRSRHDAFWSCTVCQQAYWHGTHWQQIERVRQEVLDHLGIDGEGSDPGSGSGGTH